jgi:predicted anti-sigma-YlaC factor YlaD
MSSCKDLLGALSEYLDGNEQAAMCAELRVHIASCDKCRVVVNSAKKTIELYRESDQVAEIPVDSKQRLHRTLQDAWSRRLLPPT